MSICQYCDKPVNARGMCKAHYWRWMRGADMTKPLRKYGTLRVIAPCTSCHRVRLIKAKDMCASCYQSAYNRAHMDDIDPLEALTEAFNIEPVVLAGYILSLPGHGQPHETTRGPQPQGAGR